MAFIDLTKAFDLVSIDSLFKMLVFIECPPKLLNMVRSLHGGMLTKSNLMETYLKNFEYKVESSKVEYLVQNLWHFLYAATKACFQVLNGWHLTTLQNSWSSRKHS